MFELTEIEKKKIRKVSLVKSMVTVMIFVICLIAMVKFANEDNLIWFAVSFFIGIIMFMIAMLPKKVTITYSD